MKVAYLSSAYLAPVEYYSKLLNYDKIFIEQHDHYMKQTYRNRCTIAGPEGELALSIPIVKPEEPKCPMPMATGRSSAAPVLIRNSTTPDSMGRTVSPIP